MKRRRYKYFPICVVKDVDGEDWDVFSERKTKFGFTIYRGRPYCEKRVANFAFILTPELADFLKQHTLQEAHQLLEISISLLGRLRKRLNLQRKLEPKSKEWILEHQDEILYDSFQNLKNKYNLSKCQISKMSMWLVSAVGVIREKPIRLERRIDEREKWYNQHKEDMRLLNIHQLMTQYNLSRSKAGKIYNRLSKEFCRSTLIEGYNQRLENYQNWLINHQNEILRDDIKVELIAKNLDRTKGQLLRARIALRKLLNITVEDEVINWVKANHNEVLTLSKTQLGKKYNLTEGQAIYRKKVAKRILNE